jgi:hypothetical protein
MFQYMQQVVEGVILQKEKQVFLIVGKNQDPEQIL